MLNRFSTLLFIFLFTSPLYAAVTAKVDQSTLYQGEKLTLTLETDQPDVTRPDLRMLQHEYLILGTKKVTVSSHSTNKVVTKTRWVLLLRPIGDGEKIIPSIQIGTESSPELAISILPADQNTAAGEGSLRSIFLKVNVDKDEAYINGQIILRAQVFHLSPLPNDFNLTQPESDDALIKPLEEQKEYSTIIRGQNFTVTENSYTIFPLKEGTIEISSLFFSGSLSNGSLVELNSAPLLISVLPKAITTANKLWLPASSIHIEDNLSEYTESESGKSITRFITMEAEGVPASNLPSLSPLNHKDADIKLLNVVLEEQMTEQGIISQRVEELLITPHNDQGTTIPAIEIPWWNTQTEKLEISKISERTIKTSMLTYAEAQSSKQASVVPQHNSVTSQSNSSNLLIWLLTAISLLTTLGCIYSFNQLRRLQQNAVESETELQHEQDLRDQVASDIAEKNTFQALSMACNQNNPEIAQLRLIEWGQIFWNDAELHSFEHICEYANNHTLNFLILDLEQHLYSSNNEVWQGDLLIEAIDKIRNRRQRTQFDNNTEYEEYALHTN